MDEVGLMGRLLEAVQFAALKHRDQRRKDEFKTPYINHPIGVAYSLWKEGGVTDMAVLQVTRPHTSHSTHTHTHTPTPHTPHTSHSTPHTHTPHSTHTHTHLTHHTPHTSHSTHHTHTHSHLTHTHRRLFFMIL